VRSVTGIRRWGFWNELTISESPPMNMAYLDVTGPPPP
jgi:hypothetical protein